MTLLILGLVLWTLAHYPKVWAPAWRQSLTDKLGLLPSKALFAIAIFGSVALIVIGYQRADFIEVWTPPAFFWHLNNLLMVLALFIYIAGNLPSFVRRVIRHPQLIGTKTWALAHLLVNGDLASIILFGGLLAWAVFTMIGTNRRDGPRGEKPEATTSGLLAHLGLTAVVFSVVVYVHGMLLNVWPFPG